MSQHGVPELLLLLSYFLFHFSFLLSFFSPSFLSFFSVSLCLSHVAPCSRTLPATPPPLGHHRARSWAPWSLQHPPASHLLYSWWCERGRRKWQPLQCSCLENPRDGGARWADVCGVAQSRTRLKQLSSSGVYMSTPLSQLIMHALPPAAVSICPFSTSVCLSLPSKQAHPRHFLYPTCMH